MSADALFIGADIARDRMANASARRFLKGSERLAGIAAKVIFALTGLLRRP
jgi:hypothetical protein